MPAAQAVLEVARSQLGYVEPGWGDTPGSQFTKYGSWFAAKTGMLAYQDTYWCEMFVSWCFFQAGFGADDVGLYGNCGPAVAWWKAHGRWLTGSPRAGDVVYYDWDGDGRPDHVGFVEAPLPDGRIQVIEGNATLSSGVRDGVYRLIRKPTGIVLGYARPPYSSSTQGDDMASVPQEQWDRAREQLDKLDDTINGGMGQAYLSSRLRQDHGYQIAEIDRRVQAAVAPLAAKLDAVLAALKPPAAGL
jgi:hypothetical protein